VIGANCEIEQIVTKLLSIMHMLRFRPSKSNLSQSKIERLICD
jgi:hypothetical protein